MLTLTFECSITAAAAVGAMLCRSVTALRKSTPLRRSENLLLFHPYAQLQKNAADWSSSAVSDKATNSYIKGWFSTTATWWHYYSMTVVCFCGILLCCPSPVPEEPQEVIQPHVTVARRVVVPARCRFDRIDHHHAPNKQTEGSLFSMHMTMKTPTAQHRH